MTSFTDSSDRPSRRRFLRGLGLGLGAAAAYPVLGSLGGPGSGLLVPRASAAGRAPLDRKLRVHPFLQVGAAVQPGKRVRVIVEKTSRAASSAELARAAGSRVEEEFGFIKSLVMEIPQQAVLALARNPNVRYITPDTPVRLQSISTRNLKTTYPVTIRADQVWNHKTPSTGKVTVAVLDTGGNANHLDLNNKVTIVHLNPRATNGNDPHGHGTHVIGTINGYSNKGLYHGIAPQAHVISIKICDDQGMALESDLLRGLQWCYDNRDKYTLRVVNLSITSAIAESYLTSPSAAAVEQLWFGGVVVVVSAGNRGAASDAAWYAPANDPYVITVGALDENATSGLTDDSLAPYSSRGTTQDNHYKPDLVAPGRKIVAPLAAGSCYLARTFPERIVDKSYIRLSGTSMAAPVVTGVIAMMLEHKANLTPNQVKGTLLAAARAYPGMADGRGAVDALTAYERVLVNELSTANAGLTPNQGIDPATGTVMWGQTYWDQTYWDQTYWDQTYWDQGANYD